MADHTTPKDKGIGFKDSYREMYEASGGNNKESAAADDRVVEAISAVRKNHGEAARWGVTVLDAIAGIGGAGVGMAENGKDVTNRILSGNITADRNDPKRGNTPGR